MPAPLYARYVPQKKGSKAAEQPQSQPALEKSRPENQLYARYVPPKNSKSTVPEAQLPQINNTDAESALPKNDSHATDETGKSKKRKREDAGGNSTDGVKRKERKHKTRSLEAAPGDIQEPGSPSMKAAEGTSHDNAHVLVGDGNDDYDTASAEDDEVDVKTILAKYSVSGGVKRDSMLEVREKDGAEADAFTDETADDYDPTAGAEAVFAKYRKSVTLSQKRQKKEQTAEGDNGKTPEPELHDLVPMPQPEKAPRVPYKATFSSLPSWISNPRAVHADATLPFSDLNLNPKLADNLSRKNFTNAMAVQTAVLPLLLPGRENYRGDVCVSAPTGSGKTLSYVLPMIESMQNRAMTRLRGLIVVPTRELVTQAREAAEMCASGTGVKIGAAVGSAALAAEQAQLVKRGQRYDPDARKALDEEADRRIMLGYDKDDDLLRDVADLMPDHVPDYTSNVDILICTPGRLVDHIRSTPGFTIEHVEWLVIDEADRLLDSNFQDWIDIVLPALEIVAENSARAKVLATLKERIPVKRIQKVILSATMTRDLSKLASLKLNRPTLVAVVEPEKRGERDGDVKNEDGHAAILPSTLEESAVPVGDGSEKPLYLLQLLGQRLGINPQGTESLSSTVLIFCASDNNATRLARLVALLSPQLESRTAVLTKSTATSSRRKILNSFGRPGGTSVVISTDRTSRGLDVEDLSYVVNYDIPSSVTSYVHRVGRTARAGKTGEAWTLVTDTEARWFWRAIAKGNEINRARRTVDRVRLSEADELLKEAYQDALEKLGEAVRGR